MSNKRKNKKRKLNFQSLLKAKKKAQNQEQPESANVQEMQSATDESLAFTDAESEDVASLVDDVPQAEPQESVGQTDASDEVTENLLLR